MTVGADLHDIQTTLCSAVQWHSQLYTAYLSHMTAACCCHQGLARCLSILRSEGSDEFLDLKLI